MGGGLLGRHTLAHLSYNVALHGIMEDQRLYGQPPFLHFAAS